MKKPPFNLKQYFYTHVVCFAVPNYEKKGHQEQPDKVFSVRASLIPPEEKQAFWCVSLEIGTKGDYPDLPVPYKINLQIFGVFEPIVPEDVLKKENIDLGSLIYINGATLLYSAAREYIRFLTASGPYGVLLLPTWRFSSDDLQEENE